MRIDVDILFIVGICARSGPPFTGVPFWLSLPPRKGPSPFYPLAASQPVHGKRQCARDTQRRKERFSPCFHSLLFPRGVCRRRGEGVRYIRKDRVPNEGDCIVSRRALITCVTKTSMYLMIRNPICNPGLMHYKRLLSIRFIKTVSFMYYFYTYSYVILLIYFSHYFSHLSASTSFGQKFFFAARKRHCENYRENYRENCCFPECPRTSQQNEGKLAWRPRKRTLISQKRRMRMFPRFAIYDEPGRVVLLILYILHHSTFDLISGPKYPTPIRPFPMS